MKFKRDILEFEEYEKGMEDGWETVKEINKLDKTYIQKIVKRYCGKSSYGKTFRFAFIDTLNGRFWIKIKNEIVLR